MKSVLLIGLGRFGRHLAMQLSELGHQVMAVDKDEERVNECMPFVTNAQIGDSTRVDFLRSLGVGNYDVCYVTISGNFQNSLETTSLLKELGAKYVVSRAERDVQAKFLLRNGADAVAYPEKQVAKWAAIRYTANHIFSYIELDEQHAIIEVAVPEDWRGRSIGELDKMRRKHPRRETGGKDRCEHLHGNGAGRRMTLPALGKNQNQKTQEAPPPFLNKRIPPSKRCVKGGIFCLRGLGDGILGGRARRRKEKTVP